MKTISEVCKIVGITRKTLRGYDEIGLLSPTVKSEDGNHTWLYNDDSVRVLMLIQIFVEAGYKRKKIKEVIHERPEDILKEYDCAIEMLMEKRNRINGMIKMMNSLKIVSRHSSSILLAMSRISPSVWTKQYSFSESLKESLLFYGDIKNEQTINEWNYYMPFYYGLIAIGSLHSGSPSSKQVQSCVREFIDFNFKIMQVDMSEEDKKELAKYTEAELIAVILLGVNKAFSDRNFQKEIEDLAGLGAKDFINKAIAEYGKSKCMPTEDWEHVVSKIKEEM